MSLSVGTRGGVEWTRGPCACPRWSTILVPYETQANRHRTRTSTRPPPIPSSAPCPYRTGWCIVPDFGCNIHQLLEVCFSQCNVSKSLWDYKGLSGYRFIKFQRPLCYTMHKRLFLYEGLSC